ncbi:MAG TPA: TRAP transporter small permease [Sedimenticola thiotaurini]|uniref:TRAP transporter small permease protein n=1 Tax=Sedimenticola thiotaurini TaxID=1543721 RepID=A0A831W8P3_9GAMM|nr:TRAP transporter small permease [Sedimenticola thiotaurini]
MRRFLDHLYQGAGIAAGACIVLMTLLILAQIVGRWFGIVIPSTEDFSGFLLAAASFLALAYTLRSGGHIRVTLVIGHIQGLPRRLLEGTILLLALGLAGFTAWACAYLVYESWQFQELSQGYIPVPLWIPQLPMALGLVILCIALLDELVQLLRGGRPAYLAHDEGAAVAPAADGDREP